MTQCLIVSNGHGEDYIGAQIARAICDAYPTYSVTAFSLVGDGHWYRHEHIDVISQNRSMPSGGFIRSLGDLWKDLCAGLVQHHIRQYLHIQSCRAQFDHVICVGDIFCLLLGHGSEASRTTFVPSAKSDRFMPHSWIERWIMKSFCSSIFPRDSETADSLRAHHLPATFLGNPMFDGLYVSERQYTFGNTLPVVGLLPGSRDDALLNLSLMLDVCSDAIAARPMHICLAKASTLSTDELVATILDHGWAQEDVCVFLNSEAPQCRLIITDHFPDMLAYSRVVIGLAGTANEQAVYWGKSVMTFPGFGPQTTVKRCLEQKQLLGHLIHFYPTQDVHELALALLSVIDSTDAHSVMPQNRQSSAAIVRAILA